MRLLKTKQVAELLRCSERTVLNLASAGKITSFSLKGKPKRGRERLYLEDQILEVRTKMFEHENRP